MGKQIEDFEILGSKFGRDRVTYVKNALADEAFDVFSEELDNPTVAYSLDFKEACAAVSGGKVDYCILPIEEGGDYRIPSISSMLFSYDLKIVSVTPVFGFTGDADVKYALVSSDFSKLKYEEEDEGYLEILIPMRKSDVLGQI
jgi:hypothetical protein